MPMLITVIEHTVANSGQTAIRVFIGHTSLTGALAYVNALENVRVGDTIKFNHVDLYLDIGDVSHSILLSFESNGWVATVDEQRS